MVKRYQLHLVQRVADACAFAVIAAWWKKLRRPSRDLKALDKLGMDLATSSTSIDLALPPVDSIQPEDFDSWSLSHLGHLYPGTTPAMIKLDHNRNCPWV